MGWSFRRSKSFGLFRLNFSKSGVGFSVGVPGARIGVSAKGKKYVRGGIPGTGLYYQSTLSEAQSGQAPQPGQPPQSTASVSPLGILIAVFVIGLLIYGISSSTPTITTVSGRPGATDRRSRCCPSHAQARREAQAEARHSPRPGHGGGGSSGGASEAGCDGRGRRSISVELTFPLSDESMLFAAE